MFDLNTILVPLIPILLPIIIALAAWLYHYLVQRSPANIQKLITSLAGTVVPAIEQAYADTSGSTKKSAATDSIHSILQELHINIPPVLVDLAIEAAVHDINLYSSLPPYPVGAQFTAPAGAGLGSGGTLAVTADGGHTPSPTPAPMPPAA